MSSTVTKSATTGARKIMRDIRNKFSYEEVENIVRDATSNTSNPPTPAQLAKISHTLQYHENYDKMFAMIWRRLCHLEYKRHVCKSLLVLDYLIRLKPPSLAIQLRLIVDVRERWHEIWRLAKLRTESSSDTIRQIQRVAERLCDWIMRYEQGEWRLEEEETDSYQENEENNKRKKKKKTTGGKKHKKKSKPVSPSTEEEEEEETESDEMEEGEDGDDGRDGEDESKHRNAQYQVDNEEDEKHKSHRRHRSTNTDHNNNNNNNQNSEKLAVSPFGFDFFDFDKNINLEFQPPPPQQQPFNQPFPFQLPNSNMNSWICERCTYENSLDRLDCEICSTPRYSNNPPPNSQSVPIAQPLSNQNNSSNFTWNNDINAMNQNNNSNSNTNNGLQQQSGWNCPFCSFLNKSTAKVCEVCEHGIEEHPDTHKHFDTADYSDQKEGGNNNNNSNNNHNHNSNSAVSPAGNPFLSPPSLTPASKSPRAESSVKKGLGATINPAASATLLPGAWACSWCSWLNPPTASNCEVCDKEGDRSNIANLVKLEFARKTELEKAQKLSELSWSCSRCSYVNPAARENCAACGIKYTDSMKRTPSKSVSMNNLSKSNTPATAGKSPFDDFTVTNDKTAKVGGQGYAVGRSAAPTSTAAGTENNAVDGDLLALVNAQQQDVIDQMNALAAFQKEQERVLSEHGWTCAFCSFVNHPNQGKCEMCLNSKPNTSKPSSAESSPRYSAMQNQSLPTAMQLSQTHQLQHQQQAIPAVITYQQPAYPAYNSQLYNVPPQFQQRQSINYVQQPPQLLQQSSLQYAPQQHQQQQHPPQLLHTASLPVAHPIQQPQLQPRQPVTTNDQRVLAAQQQHALYLQQQQQKSRGSFSQPQLPLAQPIQQQQQQFQVSISPPTPQQISNNSNLAIPSRNSRGSFSSSAPNSRISSPTKPKNDAADSFADPWAQTQLQQQQQSHRQLQQSFPPPPPQQQRSANVASPVKPQFNSQQSLPVRSSPQLQSSPLKSQPQPVQSAAKERVPPAAVEGHNKWICAQCTFENDSANLMCEICDSAPPADSMAFKALAGEIPPLKQQLPPEQVQARVESNESNPFLKIEKQQQREQSLNRPQAQPQQQQLSKTAPHSASKPVQQLQQPQSKPTHSKHNSAQLDELMAEFLPPTQDVLLIPELMPTADQIAAQLAIERNIMERNASREKEASLNAISSMAAIQAEENKLKQQFHIPAKEQISLAEASKLKQEKSFGTLFSNSADSFGQDFVQKQPLQAQIAQQSPAAAAGSLFSPFSPISAPIDDSWSHANNQQQGQIPKEWMQKQELIQTEEGGKKEEGEGSEPLEMVAEKPIEQQKKSHTDSVKKSSENKSKEAKLPEPPAPLPKLDSKQQEMIAAALKSAAPVIPTRPPKDEIKSANQNNNNNSDSKQTSPKEDLSIKIDPSLSLVAAVAAAKAQAGRSPLSPEAKKQLLAIAQKQRETEQKQAEKKGDLVISPTVKAKLSPEEEMNIMRGKVRDEILSTEKYYVDCLYDLITHYLDPLRKNGTKLGITPKQTAAIFNNLTVLAQFHSLFLSDLLKAQNLADVFVQFADFLKMYTQYLNGYEKSVATINALRNNKAFQKLIEEKRDLLKGRGIMSYLIQPVQRIPRYVLLLRELKKHTPAEHPERESLDYALSKIETIAEHVNESKRHVENMSKLLDIQNRIKKQDFQLFKPDRRLLKEGLVKHIKQEYIIERNAEPLQNHDTEDCLFFLFNDLVLWTSKEFDIKGNIELESLALLQDTFKYIPHNISLGIKNKPYSADMNFQCKDQQEKEEWLRYIQSAINTIHDPNRIRTKSTFQHSAVSPLISPEPTSASHSGLTSPNSTNSNHETSNSNNSNNLSSRPTHRKSLSSSGIDVIINNQNNNSSSSVAGSSRFPAPPIPPPTAAALAIESRPANTRSNSVFITGSSMNNTGAGVTTAGGHKFPLPPVLPPGAIAAAALNPQPAAAPFNPLAAGHKRGSEIMSNHAPAVSSSALMAQLQINNKPQQNNTNSNNNNELQVPHPSSAKSPHSPPPLLSAVSLAKRDSVSNPASGNNSPRTKSRSLAPSIAPTNPQQLVVPAVPNNNKPISGDKQGNNNADNNEANNEPQQQERYDLEL